MFTKRLLCAVGLLATLLPAWAQALPMLHTQGGRWLDAAGQPVALRGINLGNYLMQEFWMMGQGSAGIDDQCKLEAVLDRRFATLSANACIACSATTGSLSATGICCRR